MALAKSLAGSFCWSKGHMVIPTSCVPSCAASGKCHRLQTGFRNLRICHYCSGKAAGLLKLALVSYDLLCALVEQDWWQTSLRAPWRAERPGPPATDGSALAAAPDLHAYASPPDQMHTWHLGIGQDFAGSMVVPWQCFWCLSLVLIQA